MQLARMEIRQNECEILIDKSEGKRSLV